jgi:predicted SAM-dependent methyltransferase
VGEQIDDDATRTSTAAESLAREVYWAALPIPDPYTDPYVDPLQVGGWSDVSVRWSGLEATLRRDHGAGPLPDDPILESGSPAKRRIKRLTFKLLRPLMRRYDRIGADLALLGLETSQELALARRDTATLTSEIQGLRSDLQAFRSELQSFRSEIDEFRTRVSPKSLMTQDELPPLGEVVLELGAGANPHPRATIHHDRIVHSNWIDVAHDLTSFPWPWDDGSVDAIIAIDVFEHLKDVEVRVWLDECWRILKPAGLLVMRLPAWTNPLSYRDPTHHRVFHEESFSYWDPDHDLHRSFGRHYFEGSGRWWRVRRVFREFEDLRFDLEKLAG